MLGHRKSANERLDRVGLAFEDVAHGACLGVDSQALGLLGDIRPDLRLVRSSDATSEE